LNSAIASASDDRDTANNDAAITYQVALDLSEENLFDAQNPLITAFDASTVGADPAYAAAGTTAWDLYLVAKANAESALVQAESTAWTLYLSALSGQQSSLVAPDSFIQAQFDAQVADALSAWQASEQTAWSSYTTNMANVLNAPLLGQRILAPTPVVFAAVAPFPGLLNGVPQQLVLAALAIRIGYFSPFLALPVTKIVAIPFNPGQHYIPIKVIGPHASRLDADAVKLALGWVSGQTSPNHGNTTITIDNVTITHHQYSAALRTRLDTRIAALPAGKRLTLVEMQTFIPEIETLPDTDIIRKYNRGIALQRAEFMRLYPNAPPPPRTIAERLLEGQRHLRRLPPLLMVAAAWDALGGHVRALEIAGNSINFRNAVDALANGNIALAQQHMGSIGGGGFIAELTDAGLLHSVANPFQDAWYAAVERARDMGTAIQQGR